MEHYLRHYRALHARWPRPFDGIPEVLHFLKSQGVLVGLVTGKGPKSLPMTLEQFGLSGIFEVVKAGEIKGPVKARQIREVISEYSLDPGHVVYVGDSTADILASRQCAIGSVAAAWAPTTDVAALQRLKPDYLFTTVPEFREFVEKRYLQQQR